MQDLNEDTDVAARLRAPPKRDASLATAAGLVRHHYDDIHAAWMKDRQAGKTWDEIGRDLRPSNPISGATVGRTYARITIERALAGQLISTLAPRVAPITTSMAASPSPQRRTPFSKAIDPIRSGSNKDDQHA